MKFRFKIKVKEGDLIPLGYGSVYVDFSTFETICYPFGVHIFMALFYRLYFYLSYVFCCRYLPYEIYERTFKKQRDLIERLQALIQRLPMIPCYTKTMYNKTIKDIEGLDFFDVDKFGEVK